MFVTAWVKAARNFRMFGILSKIQEFEKQEDKKPLQKLAFTCSEMIKQLAKKDMNEIASAAQYAIELSKKINDNDEIISGKMLLTIGAHLKKSSNNLLAAEVIGYATEKFLKCQTDQSLLALDSGLQAAMIYEGLNKIHNAENILSSLLPKIDALEDSMQKGIYYFQYGSLKVIQKENDIGIKFLENADRILSPIKDNENVLQILAILYASLGNVYVSKNNSKSARIYLEKAYEANMQIKKPDIIPFADTQLNLCISYFNLGMVEKAIEIINLTKQFCLQNDYPLKAYIINNIYQSLIKEFSNSNQSDIVLKILQDYINFLTEYTPEKSSYLYDCYISIAEYNHQQKDFKASIIAATKALEYAEKIKKSKDNKELIYAFQFLSNLYTDLGDFSSVINYLEHLKSLLSNQSKNSDWIFFYSKAFLAYKKLNLISEAIDTGNKLISTILASENPDYGKILTTQLTIAEIFASLNNLDESFKYVKASENTALNAQGENSLYHFKALHHIGLVYKLKGENEVAREYSIRALKIIVKLFGDKSMEAFNTLDMLVSISISSKNWKDLVEYAQKRYELLEENKKHTDETLIKTYIALGEGFAGQNNIADAEYYFGKLKECYLKQNKINDFQSVEARIKQLKQ